MRQACLLVIGNDRYVRVDRLDNAAADARAISKTLEKLDDKNRDPNGLLTRILPKETMAPGVRVDNLIREVRKKVVKVALGASYEQVPAIYDQVVGDYYFGR